MKQNRPFCYIDGIDNIFPILRVTRKALGFDRELPPSVSIRSEISITQPWKGGGNYLRSLAVAAALMLATAASLGIPAHANLIENGDFSSINPDGTPTNWNTSASNGWAVFSSLGSITNPSGSGNFASTGCVTFCDMSQNFTLTPGSYLLSYSYNPGVAANNVAPQGGPGANFNAYWDGNLVNMIAGGSLGWSNYSANVTAAGSDVLDFSGMQFFANSGLANVSLTPSHISGAPLPGTIYDFGFGLALLGGLLYYHKRNTLGAPGSNPALASPQPS